ncbi:MAG TPA: hypothetical protein VFV76_13200 [Actinomycetes bacterium]|nr:hypothetical protein [Actinomycetes bacterium]
MTVPPAGGRGPDDEEPRGGADPRDAAHLDSDPEALEDPVHRGDAEHQRQGHQHDDEPTAPVEPSD